MEEQSAVDTGGFSGENSTLRTGKTVFLLKCWAPWAMPCPCDHSSAPLSLVPSSVHVAISLLRAVPSALLTVELLWPGEPQALSNQCDHASSLLSLHSFIQLHKTPHLSCLCLSVHTGILIPLWKIYLIENISTFVTCSPLPLSGETCFQSFSWPLVMVRVVVLLEAGVSAFLLWCDQVRFVPWQGHIGVDIRTELCWTQSHLCCVRFIWSPLLPLHCHFCLFSIHFWS